MIRFILTDIEGTTTDVNFVFGVLFPYFINNIDLLDTCQDIQVRDNAYNDIKITAWVEDKKSLPTVEAIKQQLIHYCKTDRKHPALKRLQGMVWKEGYQKGDLKAHIYPDVIDNLTSWQKQNIRIGVYSSGSVQAQHLLFEHSLYGNVKNLFSAFFDTQIGSKREYSSYQNIAQNLKINPNNILFLSDIEEELFAANKAGMQGILLCRDKWTPSNHFFTAKDFNEVTAYLVN